MLHTLPREILEIISKYIIFVQECLGYYGESDNDNRWAQEALNICSIFKNARYILIPVLWKHVSLDISGCTPREIPSGFRLIVAQTRTNSDLCYSFLNCSWIGQTVGYYSTSHCDASRTVFLPHASSMDHVLQFVKTFKIGTQAKILCKKGGFKSCPEAFHRYLTAISLVSPRTMPQLRHLILEMVLDKLADNAHIVLGRELKTFKKRIKLRLSAASPVYAYRGHKLISFLDWIDTFKLLPFVEDIDVPTIDSFAEKDDKLSKVQGITISQSPKIWDYAGIAAASTTTTFEFVTYLDVTSIHEMLVPLHWWIPPKTEVLKCNSTCLLPRCPDEEDIYRAYDKVRSLTLESSKNLCIIHASYRFYFRRLTKLQIIRKEVSLQNESAIAYFRVIAYLLSSNARNLESLKIENIFLSELQYILHTFSQLTALKLLEYNMFVRAENYNVEVNFSRIVLSWGPNLSQVSSQIEVVGPTNNYLNNAGAYSSPILSESLFPPRPSNSWAFYPLDRPVGKRSALPNPLFFNYDALCNKVRSHPKIRYQAVKIYLPSIGLSSKFFLGNWKTPKVRRERDLVEKFMFGDTFHSSQDSEHFVFTDFCEFSDPKLFYNGNDLTVNAHDPEILVPYYAVMDFVKLRALIKKKESKERVEREI